MSMLAKIKSWFSKNKKHIIIGGTIALALVGTGIGYVLYKNRKMSFSDWLKLASKEELEEAYERLRQIFCKTGTKPIGMEQISHELGERGAKEWFEKHPPNTDPNFRWTDANRWDKD
ncbi:MAG: hypothetical protein MR748_02010 [Clostridiales bacterium]|nr:hypothetical protein [Clostridiales bacterium]